MATCTKCGKLNYEGVKICTACGTPLPVAEEIYQDENEEDADSYNTNDSNSNDTSLDESERERSSRNPDEPEKKFNYKTLFLIVGILVVLAAGFFIWKAMSGGSDDVKVTFDIVYAEEPERKIEMEGEFKLIEIDQKIKFFDNTKDAETWEWDFGDVSTGSAEKEPIHVFTELDTLTVSLKVNSKYAGKMKIKVVSAPPPPAAIQTVIVPISPASLDKVVQGDKIVLKDATEGAAKFTWSPTEKGETQTTQQATFVFTVPGLKTITVKNDKAEVSGALSFEVVKRERPIPVPTEPKPKAEPKPKTEAKVAAQPKPKPEPQPKAEPKPIKPVAANISELTTEINKLINPATNPAKIEEFMSSKLSSDVYFEAKSAKKTYNTLQDIQSRKGFKPGLKIVVTEATKDAKGKINMLILKVSDDQN